MKRKIFSAVAAVCLLAGAAIGASAAPAQPYSASDTRSYAAAMSAQELEAGRLVNEIRQENGLDTLDLDPVLSQKARVKASDMKKSGYFSHTSPVYGSAFSMMKQLGIGYRSAGENIAMGYFSPAAVVHAWMASESHRANILSDRYTAMGIGFTDGYWAQWFIG